MEDPDCDSTWEDDEEEDGEGPFSRAYEGGEARRTPSLNPQKGFHVRSPGRQHVSDCPDCRFSLALQDLVEPDGNGDMPNLSFYKNEMAFLPNGCFIEDLLKNWKEDYDLLEDNHTYIQWLFPLREPGVNWHAKPLTLQEVEAFKSSPEVKERLVRAYELMLGFYGIQLKDRKTGRVCRAQNYQKRFQNLNWHSHNNLRITRMLKSLGELGLEHFQVPLTRFFLEETLVRRELPGVRQSALDYFVFTVRCRHQRRELLYFAWEHFRPRCRFVWAPLEKLQKFRPCSPPCSPRTGPRWAAKREKGPQDPVLEASAPGQTCGPGRGEEGDREDPGDEAGGEQGPASPNPKESKKRKLEASLRERAPGEPGPSALEVEKIALNLEGCALSQGGLGDGPPEAGSWAPGEAAQPCPQPPGTKVADEVRKRRKVDQGARDGAGVAATRPPAPSGCPEAKEGQSEIKEEADGQAEPEQGAPRSPAAAAETRARGNPRGRENPRGSRGNPLRRRGNPRGSRGNPLRRRGNLQGRGNPPRGRKNPWGRGNPPRRRGNPPWGRGNPPRGRENPWGRGNPLRGRENLSGRGNPPRRRGNPPRRSWWTGGRRPQGRSLAVNPGRLKGWDAGCLGLRPGPRRWLFSVPSSAGLALVVSGHCSGHYSCREDRPHPQRRPRTAEPLPRPRLLASPSSRPSLASSL
uniref:Opioid growth factor receptor n=1 Tax=Sus scrofa TaxID=9823 RepID=A0A8W4FNH8_PIG